MSKFYIATDDQGIPKLGFFKAKGKSVDILYGKWADIGPLIKGPRTRSLSKATEQEMLNVITDRCPDVEEVIIYEFNTKKTTTIEFTENDLEDKEEQDDDQQIPELKSEAILIDYFKKKKPSYKSTNKNGENLLHIASRAEYKQAMNLLIQNDYDVNYRSAAGEPPIIYAVAFKLIGAIRILIESGARYNDVITAVQSTSYLGQSIANDEEVRLILDCFPEVSLGKEICVQYESKNNSFVLIKNIIFNRSAIQSQQFFSGAHPIEKNLSSKDKDKKEDKAGHRCHILPFAWIAQVFEENIVNRHYREIFAEIKNGLVFRKIDVSNYKLNKLDMLQLIKIWFLHISQENNLEVGSADGNLAKAWLYGELKKELKTINALICIKEEKQKGKFAFKVDGFIKEYTIPGKFREWFKKGAYHCYLKKFIEGDHIIVRNKHEFLELYQISLIDDDTFGVGKSKNDIPIYKLICSFGITAKPHLIMNYSDKDASESEEMDLQTTNDGLSF